MGNGKIKQLASQTIWYGASNIGAKLLNYMLTPFLTRVLHTSKGLVEFGDISILYSCIALINIIYTYGFETAYFRFSNKEGVEKKNLFQTAFSSIVFSTIGLSLLLIFFRAPLSHLIKQDGHSDYIVLAILIIAFDTLSAIPLAKLRQENRPRRYAMVNVGGVAINVLLTILFVGVWPHYAETHSTVFLAQLYYNFTNVQLLLFANLAQAVFAFLLLLPQWKGVALKIDKALWHKMFAYSSPMIIVGLGGMINETVDRVLLLNFVPGTEDAAKTVVSIYSANYKLAIIITMFIQAFRMSAEPFFFNQAKSKDSPQLYARIMKWFVIVMCVAFLITLLYIDIWKYLVGASYRSGLSVVPILLCANICLGIYYNQSIWYKLTDKIKMGMFITLGGVIVTLLVNIIFIPRYGMYASAWATFLCYCSMMIWSYVLGHKYYPIPYNVKKLLAYIGVALILFFLEKGFMAIVGSTILHLLFATILMCVFLLLVIFAEKKELRAMPKVGKYIDKYFSKF